MIVDASTDTLATLHTALTFTCAVTAIGGVVLMTYAAQEWWRNPVITKTALTSANILLGGMSFLTLPFQGLGEPALIHLVNTLYLVSALWLIVDVFSAPRKERDRA